MSIIFTEAKKRVKNLLVAWAFLKAYEQFLVCLVDSRLRLFHQEAIVRNATAIIWQYFQIGYSLLWEQTWCA